MKEYNYERNCITKTITKIIDNFVFYYIAIFLTYRVILSFKQHNNLRDLPHIVIFSNYSC